MPAQAFPQQELNSAPGGYGRSEVGHSATSTQPEDAYLLQ